jgi:hypothetical protein
MNARGATPIGLKKVCRTQFRNGSVEDRRIKQMQRDVGSDGKAFGNSEGFNKEEFAYDRTPPAQIPYSFLSLTFQSL